jgi:hypothetical protein
MARTQNQVSYDFIMRYLALISKCSCQAHVINLGTQVLISTYSKSPHYTPHEPKAHEPDTSNRGDRDEIGLVRTICVKVHPLTLHLIFGINF